MSHPTPPSPSGPPPSGRPVSERVSERPGGERFTREELLAAPGPGFRYQTAVRFQDIDAAGIIFFPRVLEHCHDGLVHFMAQAGCDLPTALRTRAFAAPLAHAEADYLRPLRFGDPLTVVLCAARCSDTRATLGFRVLGADDAVAALAQLVHVFIDPQSARRVPIPPALRAAFDALA